MYCEELQVIWKTTKDDLSHLYVASKNKKQKTQTYRQREQTGSLTGMQVHVCVLKIGESGQKLQSISYKINKSWGCNAEHSDCSYNAVLYIWKVLKE